MENGDQAYHRLAVNWEKSMYDDVSLLSSVTMPSSESEAALQDVFMALRKLATVSWEAAEKRH